MGGKRSDIHCEGGPWGGCHKSLEADQQAPAAYAPMAGIDWQLHLGEVLEGALSRRLDALAQVT